MLNLRIIQQCFFSRNKSTNITYHISQANTDAMHAVQHSTNDRVLV